MRRSRAQSISSTQTASRPKARAQQQLLRVAATKVIRAGQWSHSKCGLHTKSIRCCPGACSCIQQQNQNGYIGCCPIGQTCGGPVSVETVTVTAQAQPTALVVSPQQYTTTYSNPNPYTAPPAAVFCQTLTMHGPGLPVVTQGSCGTILIVEGGSKSLKPVVFGIAGVLFLAQLAIARTFHRI